MLFFKDIVKEKFNESGFKNLYKKECHICSVTMKIISMLEDDSIVKERVCHRFDISEEAYENLKRGDHCHPEMVWQICDYLKICDQTLAKLCSRYKTKE